MKIFNRDARRRYTILDTVEAGIALTGSEVKSVRLGHVDLSGSYVTIQSGNTELVNAHISPYPFARHEEFEPKRRRRLLLKKDEIISLSTKIEHTSLTLIPVSLYTMGAFIKIEVGVARGKKKHDMREDLKKRAMQRDIEEEIKRY